MSTVRPLASLLTDLAEQPAALGPRVALAQALLDRGVPAASGAFASLARLASGRGQFVSALALTLRRTTGGTQDLLLRELAERYGAERWSVGTRQPPPLVGPLRIELPQSEDRQVDLALRLLQDNAGLTLPADALVPEVPLFSALPVSAFSAVARALVERTFGPDEVIIAQGPSDRRVFFLAQGRVRVETTRPDGTVSVIATATTPALLGEMSLVTDVPRRASVTAIEPTLVWQLDFDTVNRLCRAHPELGEQLERMVKRRLVANVMRHSRLLGGLALPESFVQAFQIVPLAAGVEVITQGADAPGLFVVLHGEAHVWSRSQTGELVRVSTLVEGDVFGEASLLSGRPTNASVRFATGGIVLHLKADDFQRLRGAAVALEEELSLLDDVRHGELADMIDAADGDSGAQVDDGWLLAE